MLEELREAFHNPKIKIKTHWTSEPMLETTWALNDRSHSHVLVPSYSSSGLMIRPPPRVFFRDVRDKYLLKMLTVASKKAITRFTEIIRQNWNKWDLYLTTETIVKRNSYKITYSIQYNLVFIVL